MRRLLHFLLRNWPLKVGAVLLASVLYGGLVLSQNVRTFAGPVQLEAIRQPAEIALLSELPPVTQIRYRAPLDVIISPATFTATADLSRVIPQPDGQPVDVGVTVVALDTRVQVVGYEPSSVQVYADPVETRSVTVRVETGSVPEGLTLGSEQVDPPRVTVRGASSRVAAIRSVVARVAIDASGLNVDREVDATPIDEQGNLVTNVDVEPPRVRVRIPVARQLANRTLPVLPQLTGRLPNGLHVVAIEVVPAVVTLSGEESTLADLDGAPTEEIALDERVRDFETDVLLALPSGVTVNGRGEVRVSVSIAEDSATRSYSVGVELAGARAHLSYAIAASQVSVTLGGPISALDAADASQLVASASVAGLGPGRHVVALSFRPPPRLELVSISQAATVVEVREPLPEDTPAPNGVSGEHRPPGRGQLLG